MATPRIYFDLCTIKRPWDDQSNVRIATETAAVLAIFRHVSNGHCVALRSPALDVENMHNSLPERAAVVAEWLESLPLPTVEPDELGHILDHLISCGFKPMDAIHLAWAVVLNAAVFITTDDRLLRKALKHPPAPSLLVQSPLITANMLGAIQ